MASAVWGQQSGNWINLTANANYAIVWSSANTNIATVDIAGNVTGIAAGTTAIIASYPALGLSASQSVQVVNVPLSLVHRYSFSETSGTNVADSVGGAAWNGILPNGGTWLGGQLALLTNSTKSLSQYLQLPAGILSNYTQVTIETWVTFPDQLPVNCFFFGFGTFSGGTGYNYIFCAPRAGRAAITSGNNSSEQNAYTGIDFSYHTNFHLTFVFNPPAGYLAIYTNGILAGINNSVTIGFNSVSDLYSWIGRSLYSGDPYPDFTLERIPHLQRPVAGRRHRGHGRAWPKPIAERRQPDRHRVRVRRQSDFVVAGRFIQLHGVDDDESGVELVGAGWRLTADCGQSVAGEFAGLQHSPVFPAAKMMGRAAAHCLWLKRFPL